MLTDVDCRKAVCPPDAKRKRLTDSGGLYLEVAPNGSKRWFWKFYPDGKESRLALGSYPAVSLKEARLARDAAKRERHEGVNPVVKRKAERAAGPVTNDGTFEAVARELHALKKAGWSDTYAARWLDRMEKDLFPWIGAMPLRDITARVLLGVLNRVVKRGALETAHSLRQWSSQVFRYGLPLGLCERDSAADLVGSLPPINVKNVSAIVTPEGVGGLLRAIAAYGGQTTTRAAMLMSALTFQRPGNIRAMCWSEIDVEAAMWTIPALKMKRTVKGKLNGRPHFVPLSPQALVVLDEVRPITGDGVYVFPATVGQGRHMSENTVRTALRRMGYTNDEHTPHGFRAMARTILVERLSIPSDVIEAQLAHAKSGPLGSAYDRAEFIEQRREMMVKWANYLDQLRDGAKVIAFRAA